jgi:hypothetical protein
MPSTGLNWSVNRADARAVDPVAMRPVDPWRRKTLMIAAAVVVLAVAGVAVGVWLRVADTIRHPDPVSIPPRPPVKALAWSDRVFLDAPTFRSWLAARGYQYADWARKHPQGRALLEDRRRSAR